MYSKKQIETIKADTKDISYPITEYLRQCLCNEFLANTEEKTKLFTSEGWDETNQCLQLSYKCIYNNTTIDFTVKIKNNNIGDE